MEMFTGIEEYAAAEQSLEKAEITPEQRRIMEQEGVSDQQVWTTGELTPVAPTLPFEVSEDVPGMDSALICGDPITLGEILDSIQGFDNPYGNTGTCGLVSVSNICKMAGKDVTEPEVVKYAMENNLCEPRDGTAEKMGGATTLSQQVTLLEHYGLPSHCEFADTATPERLAELVEGGHGVMLALNSGVMQDREWKIFNKDGEIEATHSVTVTGTVRDVETGELKGLYMCDSSGATRESGRVFVSTDLLKACYSDVIGGCAVVTDAPIRSSYTYEMN